jgi:hypothetical protein
MIGVAGGSPEEDMAFTGNDMKQEDKVSYLTMAVKDTLTKNVVAKRQATGTLTITVEINLSQGGIGHAYLSEHFRQRVGGQ